MAKKPFALRLDEKMMQAVEKWAEDEFRSTNGQIEWIIHEALKKARRIQSKNGQDSKS
ncbi:Arc family DNA-binding protein [Belliella sp. DSM 111904]|uniref:Arc family DNA-binding protein n=1 Tax=Belliella filtrata TaxID=2923435 RepID=A0ABS9V490_9BACT|nr:Arc family DNA-binding protein [Belliella filtrata]MCH7410798.1 Arc family DNA-binding protein [Belliella filtrata]